MRRPTRVRPGRAGPTSSAPKAPATRAMRAAIGSCQRRVIDSCFCAEALVCSKPMLMEDRQARSIHQDRRRRRAALLITAHSSSSRGPWLCQTASGTLILLDVSRQRAVRLIRARVGRRPCRAPLRCGLRPRDARGVAATCGDPFASMDLGRGHGSRYVAAGQRRKGRLRFPARSALRVLFFVA